MKSQVTPSWGFPPTWFRFLVICLLVLGIFFRFANLDKKIYWLDEVINSFRISGYTSTELTQDICNGDVISIEDLQKYQHPSPDKDVIGVIKIVASEEPQNTPLYYIIARFWVQWFGHSVVVRRSLSALISLLAFPCIYWLCLELFNSSLIGWMAIALIAISPFHILYAQEVRPYGLWTVMILLSSATLLQAIRLQTKFSWVIYGTVVTLGLYTFPFTLFVIIGYGIYVIVIEGFRASKTVTAYLVSSGSALFAFFPWLYFILENSHKMGDWRAKEIGILPLIKIWILNLSRVFFDIEFSFINSFKYSIALILILIAYSIYYLWLNTPKQVWLFVVTLTGVTALALIFPDLVLGGRRSTVSRYLIPSYLGIELAVAYLLSTKITSSFTNSIEHKLWHIAIFFLISIGVLSCAISSPAQVSWNKYQSVDNLGIAPIINQADSPLLLSDGLVHDVISLSYLLDSKVRFQLTEQSIIPKIIDQFSDLFLFNCSNKFRAGIEKELNYRIKPVYLNQLQLWKVVKVESN
ncbi:MAG TPA: hypothetical protein DD379_21935 [Cyanobacteria bacterium UBA11162]|nr:hypothetical protein [Cyanobacteria bacterium UBA11162]